jgi:hypothetical protein
VDYSALRHCTELRDAHIIEAVKSSDAMEALLTRFAEIAGPGKGGPVILAALARLGTTACDWIDGELRIDITGDAAQTKIAVSSSLGAGFREKCFSDTILRVPLEEFSRLLARSPKLIEPLQIAEHSPRIVLTAPQEVRATSLPPPMVEIDAASLINVPPLDAPYGMELELPETPPEPKIVLRPRVKADGEQKKSR